MLGIELNEQNVAKVLNFAARHHLNVDPQLASWYNKQAVACNIANFNFTLKKFQAEGVRFLEKMNGRCLVADEQGTGKTVVVTAYAHKNNKMPMLIICPNSLKFNWRNEIVAMTGNQYKINIVGNTYSAKALAERKVTHPNVTYSKTPVSGHDIYIINFDIVGRNLAALIGLGLKFVAVDESQKIKNSKAERTKSVVSLVTGMTSKNKQPSRIGPEIESVVFMSGTPQVNRPVELWTTVNTLAPWVDEFSKFNKFAFKFCGARHNGYGWDFTGSSNHQDLHNLLVNNIMIRRLKKDVLSELPPKVVCNVPLEFDRAKYDQVARGFDGIDWKSAIETIVAFGGNPPSSSDEIVAIQKLREIAAMSKLAATVEWIKDHCETNPKLVVFAHHRNVIDYIKKHLVNDREFQGEVVTITGSDTNDERAEAVQRFQNDPKVKVVIVGITAGGFGLTLTAANSVAFVQLPWSPGEFDQCSDRVHRVGQTASSVNIYVLVAENTIEEAIAGMIANKKLVFDAVIDGV